MAEHSLGKRLKMIQETILVILGSCFLTAAVDSYHTDCSKVPSFNLPGCTCHCGAKSECANPVAISCMKAGFTNVTIKQAFSNLPASVEQLSVQGDHIPELPKNIFGEHHPLVSKKLKVLDLSGNHIKLIHGKTFHGVHNITKLILDNNDWYIRQKVRVFSNFDRLEVLSLNNAFNDTIDGNMHAMQLNFVFLSSELPRLRELQLTNNNLTNGTLGVLHYLSSIQKVNLAYNDLTYVHLPQLWVQSVENIDLTHNLISALSDHTTEALDIESRKRSISLYMGNNPYHCNCSERHFLRWLNTTDVVKDKDKMHCALPARLQGRLVYSVREEELEDCLSSQPEQRRRSSRGSVIAVAVVVGLLCVLFLAVLYMNREKLKRKTRSWVQSVGMALGIHSHRGYSNVEPVVSTI